MQRDVHRDDVGVGRVHQDGVDLHGKASHKTGDGYHAGQTLLQNSDWHYSSTWYDSTGTCSTS